MQYLTESEIRALPIGTRVVFPEGASAYPDFHFTDRLTGSVVRQEDDSTWVKIDQYKPELDEWENEIQVWRWERNENDQAAYNMAKEI
jgi:hypothetical protein